jgi:formylglycine-generating enzyme
MHGRPLSADDMLPKPGEVREYEIADGVKMKFCWVPPGKAKLGSPKTEKERSENEGEHDFECKGFWLGKYPVSQIEWQALMKNNPSAFSKNGLNSDKVTGMDADRFPVENVSCEDCEEFLKKMNRGGDGKGTFGKRGKFVLPTEDEWEYACRGGRGNAQAFYFGDSLNGKQANCHGAFPYNTDAKGPDKDRTTKVGDYEAVAPHPWGLCDMHGNVWQWCQDWQDEKHKLRSCRGGSYDNEATACRAASRFWMPSRLHWYSFGFRVCFRTD